MLSPQFRPSPASQGAAARKRKRYDPDASFQSRPDRTDPTGLLPTPSELCSSSASSASSSRAAFTANADRSQHERQLESDSTDADDSFQCGFGPASGNSAHTAGMGTDTGSKHPRPQPFSLGHTAERVNEIQNLQELGLEEVGSGGGPGSQKRYSSVVTTSESTSSKQEQLEVPLTATALGMLPPSTSAPAVTVGSPTTLFAPGTSSITIGSAEIEHRPSLLEPDISPLKLAEVSMLRGQKRLVAIEDIPSSSESSRSPSIDLEIPVPGERDSASEHQQTECKDEHAKTTNDSMKESRKVPQSAHLDDKHKTITLPSEQSPLLRMWPERDGRNGILSLSATARNTVPSVSTAPESDDAFREQSRWRVSSRENSTPRSVLPSPTTVNGVVNGSVRSNSLNTTLYRKRDSDTKEASLPPFQPSSSALSYPPFPSHHLDRIVSSPKFTQSPVTALDNPYHPRSMSNNKSGMDAQPKIMTFSDSYDDEPLTQNSPGANNKLPFSRPEASNMPQLIDLTTEDSDDNLPIHPSISLKRNARRLASSVAMYGQVDPPAQAMMSSGSSSIVTSRKRPYDDILEPSSNGSSSNLFHRLQSAPNNSSLPSNPHPILLSGTIRPIQQSDQPKQSPKAVGFASSQSSIKRSSNMPSSSLGFSKSTFTPNMISTGIKSTGRFMRSQATSRLGVPYSDEEMILMVYMKEELDISYKIMDFMLGRGVNSCHSKYHNKLRPGKNERHKIGYDNHLPAVKRIMNLDLDIEETLGAIAQHILQDNRQNQGTLENNPTYSSAFKGARRGPSYGFTNSSLVMPSVDPAQYKQQHPSRTAAGSKPKLNYAIPTLSDLEKTDDETHVSAPSVAPHQTTPQQHASDLGAQDHYVHRPYVEAEVAALIRITINLQFDAATVEVTEADSSSEYSPIESPEGSDIENDSEDDSSIREGAPDASEESPAAETAQRLLPGYESSPLADVESEVSIGSHQGNDNISEENPEDQGHVAHDEVHGLSDNASSDDFSVFEEKLDLQRVSARANHIINVRENVTNLKLRLHYLLHKADDKFLALIAGVPSFEPDAAPELAFRSQGSIENYLKSIRRQDLPKMPQMLMDLKYGTTSNRQFRDYMLDFLVPSATFKSTSGDVACVRFHPDNIQFAVGSHCVVDQDNMQYNRDKNFLLGHAENKRVHEIADHFVVRERPAAGINSTLEMHASQDERLYQTVSMVDFSPSGSHLYSAGYDKKLRAYNLGKDTNPFELEWEHSLGSRADLLRVSPTHGLIAAGIQSAENAIVVLDHDVDANAKKLCLQLTSPRSAKHPAYESFPTALKWGNSFYPNLLAAGFQAFAEDDEGKPVVRDYGELCLWDVDSGYAHTLRLSSQPVFDCNWAPNDRLMVAALSPAHNALTKGSKTTKTIVAVYSMTETPATWSCRSANQMDCPARDINDVIICPYDSNYVAAGATDGKVYVWDRRRGTQVLHTCFSEDSTDTPKRRTSTEDGAVGVRFCSWGHTLGRLYSGSSDGVVRVWDVRHNTDDVLLPELANLNSGVMSADLSSDFSRMIVGEEDGSVTLLDLAPDGLRKQNLDHFDFVSDSRRTQAIRNRISPIPANDSAPSQMEHALPVSREAAFFEDENGELFDNGRWQHRIPANLRALATTAFKKRKTGRWYVKSMLKCSYCENDAEPRAGDDEQMKFPLCELCGFGCFKCDNRIKVDTVNWKINCKNCRLTWNVGTIGYELDRKNSPGVHKTKPESTDPNAIDIRDKNGNIPDLCGSFQQVSLEDVDRLHNPTNLEVTVKDLPASLRLENQVSPDRQNLPFQGLHRSAQVLHHSVQHVTPTVSQPFTQSATQPFALSQAANPNATSANVDNLPLYKNIDWSRPPYSWCEPPTQAPIFDATNIHDSALLRTPLSSKPPGADDGFIEEWG